LKDSFHLLLSRQTGRANESSITLNIHKIGKSSNLTSAWRCSLDLQGYFTRGSWPLQNSN